MCNPDNLKQTLFHKPLMISALIHFVQTGFRESDDVIISILSEVILGNWLHR